MHYDSYKHYVISGHIDSKESYRAYYCAIGRNSADECGMTFTDNMRRFYERIADGHFSLRFAYALPATL